jgi:hypothetical protein
MVRGKLVDPSHKTAILRFLLHVARDHSTDIAPSDLEGVAYYCRLQLTAIRN